MKRIPLTQDKEAMVDEQYLRPYFDDFDEAVAWRDAKARELHGEFAYLNGAT